MSLKAEITAVQEQINTTEAENAKYSGGLVKALMTARVATLRQTEAMLQQRLKASTFGISLKYTIDGSSFVPPASANDLLRSVEQELSDNQAKITRQEAETARYSGGLVQAMSLSTLATMRQTQAMLDQKRLALKYGLPQYVGFHSQADSAPATSKATPQTEITTTSSPKNPPKPFVPPPFHLPESNNAPKVNAAVAASNEKDWRILSVDTRVTESNSVWSKYAWKVTLRNDSDQPQAFKGTIEFQDSDGFIVDTGSARDMLVPARSEEVFTGYALIRAEVAGKVARTVAKIGKGR